MKIVLLLAILLTSCGGSDKNCGCCTKCDRSGLEQAEKCGCCEDCGTVK